MRERSNFSAVTAAAVLGAIGATNVAAQASAPETPPDAKSCVYLPDIDHTKIVDDRNILFYLRDDTILQNSLREPCYGLRAKNRFTYGSSSLKRLCTGDMITLLTDLSFGGVAPSNTCKLGMFLPVDQDEADDVLAAAGKDKGGQKKQAIKSAPVELAPDDAPKTAPISPAGSGPDAPQAATEPAIQPATPPPTR
jgi:hypothetical protein